MIEGPIDGALDGAANQQRLRAIRDRVAAQHDARVPFLLLPLRIETRFLRVDVPAGDPGPTLAELIARLAAVTSALTAVRERPLATRLGAAPRKRVRAGEIASYAFLDQTLAALAAVRDDVAPLVREASGSVAELEPLVAAGAAALAAADAAIANAGRLRSAFQAAAYQARLSAFRDEVLAPLADEIAHGIAPRVRIWSELAVAGGRERPPRATPVRTIAPGAVARSAVASHAVDRLLDEGAREVATLARNADREAAALAIAAVIAERTGRAAALARTIEVVPAAARRSRVVAHERLVAAFAPWAAFLDELAAHGGAAGTRAREARAAAIGALDAEADVLARLATDEGGAIDVTAVPTRTIDQLWVRFYPDDVAIDSHQTALTAGEAEDGRAFWHATIAAGADDGLRRAAWRGLVERRGARRAAYIARVLEPVRGPIRPTFDRPPWLSVLRTLDRRLADTTGAPGWFLADPVARLARVRSATDAAAAALGGATATREHRIEATALADSIRARTAELDRRLRSRARFLPDAARPRAALDDVTARVHDLARDVAALPPPPATATPTALSFPDVEITDRTWGAPACKVLPDRLVAVAVRGGHVRHAVVGEAIGELAVGPDPDADPTESFVVGPDGRLTVPAPLRWMTDFDEAVARGMAVKITLTAEDAREGFDELLVIGVRPGTADEQRAQLERLLDNHHYNEQGLGLLPIGTPTNNTEDGAAGYRSDDGDDPEASYARERGAPLFDANPAGIAAADGLRLARALGVAPAVFAHVGDAGGLDGDRAAIVNRALWPATAGAYGEELLGRLMAPDTLARVERFFVEHVSARGPVPAIRVGAQPYGALVTTAFSRFASATGALPGPDATAEADRARRFELLFVELLAHARRDWSRIRRTRVRHAHGDAGGDPQRHFLEMLGLHPTGVGLGYRFALNVATRPKAAFGFAPEGPLGLIGHFQGWFERAFAIPHGPIVAERGLVAPAWKDLYERVFEERAYDVRLLDQVHSLRGPLVGGDHAGDLAELLAAAPSALVTAGATGRGRSRALVYLLARQALLVRLRSAALAIAEREGLLDATTRRRLDSADEFAVSTLRGSDHASRWSYLFAPLPDLDGRLGLDFPRGPGTLLDYLGTRPLATYLAQRGANAVFDGFAGHVRHDGERAALADHADAVAQLAAIPATALDELVREHVDLCSHRLDAWVLGLANRRLAEMRAQAPGGIYLGAFGWVEDLRPGGARTLATGLPPSLHVPGEAVYADADDQGFVHAPSITHAVAAAILRSGHRSETDRPDLENRMAVNLSSRRVRGALAILDGVHAGHDLGSLLGYRLERELHEAYARERVTLDDLIAGFRRAFPGAVAVDDASLATAAASRVVTDGLRLLDVVRGWMDRHVSGAARRDRTVYDVLADEGRFTGYPWGVVGPGGARVLPHLDNPADAVRLPAVLRAIDQLADVVDALADLALTESVYQIVRGNFPRAAAVLSAVAEGRAMPRPEVVDTPRTGTAVTHRIVLALPSAVEPAPGWDAAPSTARAAAEPRLDRWLAEQLGDPATIQVRYRDPSDPVGAVRALSIAELGLQPIDLLALCGPGLDAAEAELTARIVARTLPAGDLAATLPRLPLDIRLVERDPAAPATERTLFEIGPLLAAAHDLLATARAADADDLHVNETLVAAGTGATPAIDLAELTARVGGARDRLRALAVELMADLAGAATGEDPFAIDPEAFLAAHAGGLGDDASIVARYAPFASRLLRAAEFGVRGALPPVRLDDVAAVAAALAAALRDAFTQVIGRLQRAAAAAGPDADAQRAIARALFGPGLRLVPRFTAPDPAELAAQLASPALLHHAGPRAIDRFVHGAAAVRPRLAHLTRAALFGEAFGRAPLRPAVAQYPAHPGDLWLGAELPADHAPSGNKLSLLVLDHARWNTAGPIAALLVDEWTETLPNPTETTAVAFFYDQPDAAPPQSLLLAVPPTPGGAWSWDDLVHTLHDTLDLARSRTVELEHLGDQVYGQLLPAIVGELVPDRFGGDPVSGHRVILDFHDNNG